MFARISLGVVAAIAVSAMAPAASAAVPDDVLGSFLDGFAAAFGSSDGAPSTSRQTGTIYPDAESCYREARRVRSRPDVRLAECNPVGGAGGQYQLIVMTR